MSTAVFVVEDHTLVRQSLVALLEAADDIEVVGQAASVEEARPRVLAQPPDVLMLDVNLPGEDGLSYADEVHREGVPTRVLVLTMHEDVESLRRATEAAVAGYLTKVATQDEVLTGVRSIAAGGSYLSPCVAAAMMDAARGAGSPERLTDRESEILQLLAKGERVGDIATRLCLSSKTVQNHLSHVYTKLGVESGAQAVVEAFRRGLVHL